NGPVKLTIARTSELSHRRTLLLSHYSIGALNAFYVKYQSLELLIYHVSMCLSCRDSKIMDVTH
ncbi:hypothetical protein, partial [Klebsiella variicola]